MTRRPAQNHLGQPLPILRGMRTTTRASLGLPRVKRLERACLVQIHGPDLARPEPVRVAWTNKAVSDVARLHEFLAPVNSPAAARVVRR
jgi:hypothetical protein